MITATLAEPGQVVAVGQAVARLAHRGEKEAVVALPETFVTDDVVAFRSVSGLALTRVGDVRSGAGVHARLGGRAVVLAGYDHFASRHR